MCSISLLESQCDWPDTEVNHRRHIFCNKLEGYGSVCSCTEPAPLVFNPQPVSCFKVESVPPLSLSLSLSLSLCVCVCVDVHVCVHALMHVLKKQVFIISIIFYYI